MQQRVAVYLRSSPALSSTTQDQHIDLQKLAHRYGITIAAVHRDTAPRQRKSSPMPGLTLLMDGIKAGSYGVVLVESLYLLARDLPELVRLLAAMDTASVRLLTVMESIDTGAAPELGLLDVATLLNGWTKFRRREASLAAHDNARRNGVKIGRPSLDQQSIDRVRSALIKGHGLRPTARAAGVSASSVVRVRDCLVAEGLLAAPG
jgi:DNA invertase Pin-like site-specific DNA recombinase